MGIKTWKREKYFSSLQDNGFQLIPEVNCKNEFLPLNTEIHHPDTVYQSRSSWTDRSLVTLCSVAIQFTIPSLYLKANMWALSLIMSCFHEFSVPSLLIKTAFVLCYLSDFILKVLLHTYYKIFQSQKLWE